MTSLKNVQNFFILPVKLFFHSDEVAFNRESLGSLFTDEAGRITRYEYDEWLNLTRTVYPDGSEVSSEYEHTYNRKISETDENGVVTRYQYDAAGNLTQKTEAEGTAEERIIDYTYNTDGNLLTITRRGQGGNPDAITEMTYDAVGNLTSVTDPQGGITQFTEHDAMGNVLKKIDARGKTWLYEYDDAGRLTRVTDPLSHATEMFYDAVGNKIREVDPEGRERQFEYDSRNNMIQSTVLVDPADETKNLVTRFEYDAEWRLLKQIDPEGKEVLYTYDADGRLAATTDGAGNVISMEYAEGEAGCASCGAGTGAADQPSRIVYPTFEKTFNYDARGRKTVETDVLSETEALTTSFSFDPGGNLIAKTDKNNKTTGYAYDALNRLATVTDPLLNDTTYTYDERDNLVALTDAESQTTQFEYDLNNRLVKETRPMGQETHYDYDDAGNLVEKIDAKNQRTEYNYDDAGRLEQINYFSSDDPVNPVKTVVFTYDLAGNLTGYDDGTTSAVYAYDPAGRKVSETVAYTQTLSLGYTYQYYKNGLKKTFTGQDGVTYTYTYDEANRLTGVQIPNTGMITVSAYDWNRPSEMTLPGGTKRTYTYDPLLRIKQITAKDPGQNTVLDYAYSYDTMDNITEKTTGHGAYDYGYDDLYRLVSTDNPSQADEAYSYDGVGNRLTSAEYDDWDYNPNNELQAYDGVTFEYDKNGNTVRKTDNGVVTEYVYNTEDRLVEVRKSGSLTASYYYDPFGSRLWKDVGGVRTYFIYADEGLVAETDGSGAVTKTYGYKPGSTWTTDPLFMKEGGKYYFYHNDHLGTPQKMTAVNGAVVWAALYSSFGEAQLLPMSTVENNLRFAGQYYDSETGLHYNYYRYYDPKSGRYFRKDPIGAIGGINIYLYSLSNPNLYSDPFGLKVEGRCTYVSGGEHAKSGAVMVWTSRGRA